jgi:hypothetical protein
VITTRDINARRNSRAIAPLSPINVLQGMPLFDDLPRSVRRALHEAGVNWCPAQQAERYRVALERFGWAAAEDIIVKQIRAIDAAERQRFADDFEAQFGAPYPARAAGSTLTRYERRA